MKPKPDLLYAVQAKRTSPGRLRRNLPCTPRALFITVCLLFPAVRAAGQTIVHSFDGDSGPGLAVCESGVTHCDRPEMDVAVDGKQVVQVTWQNVRVYDYSGRLLKSTPMATFIRNAGLDPLPTPAHGQPPSPTRGPFEPHIVYDEFINRWIITITGLNDSVLVSGSPDPMGAWGGTYVSCRQGGPCLNYDPGLHIGYDRNGVYVCGAHLGDDNPNTPAGAAYDCFAVPQAEVQGIAQGRAPAHLNRAHNLPLDVVPAIDHNRNKPPGAPAFFVAKSCARTAGGCQRSTNFSFDWLVNTFTWNGATGTWNAGGGQQMVKTDVGSTRSQWLYNTPCCGKTFSIAQAGSTVNLRAATSHRLMNLVQFGSHLHGVLGSGPCTSGCGSQGTDANNVMFWVDLDCSKTTACVVRQTDKISGAAFNAEFGTVGVDEAGNIGIVAVSATAGTNLSLLLWTRRREDHTFNGPTTIIAGTQPYTCLNANDMTSMGSATGVLTALDPADGSKLWTTQQWANDSARCVWNTRIVEYQIDGGKASPAGQSRPKDGK